MGDGYLYFNRQEKKYSLATVKLNSKKKIQYDTWLEGKW